jgi:hypothetical protein
LLRKSPHVQIAARREAGCVPWRPQFLDPGFKVVTRP